MKKIIFAVSASAAFANTAQAQDENFAAKMREVNASAPSPENRAIEVNALATLQAIAKEKAQCIPTGMNMEKAAPATADRMAIQAVQAGKLKNLWLAYGKPVGCPGAAKIRFMVLQTPDGSVRARVVNDGESIASPTLMRDTSKNAALVALYSIKVVDSSCEGRDMEMVTTKLSSMSADLLPDFYGVRYGGSWEEVWTFKACGRLAEVPVSFKADGAGGAYTNVNQKAVKLLDR